MVFPFLSPTPDTHTHTHTQAEQHTARLAELDAITAERDETRKRFEDLRKQRLDQFMTGFSTITYKLKEMYQVWKKIISSLFMNILPGACIDKFFAGQVYSVFPPRIKKKGEGG